MQPPPLSGRALRAIVSVVEGPAGAAAYALVKREAGIAAALALPLEAHEGPPPSQRPLGPAPFVPPVDREGAA